MSKQWKCRVCGVKYDDTIEDMASEQDSGICKVCATDERII
jgi:rubredoxin